MKRIPVIRQLDRRPVGSITLACRISPKDHTVPVRDGLYRAQQHRNAIAGFEIPAIVKMIDAVIGTDKDIFFVIWIDHGRAFDRLCVQLGKIDHRAAGRLAEIDDSYPQVTDEPDISRSVFFEIGDSGIPEYRPKKGTRDEPV